MNPSQTSERMPANLPTVPVGYILWKILTFGVLFPVYLSMVAEPLRMEIPALGQKLYKLSIPGFSTFGNYVETRRLDLAMVMAICLLVAVWWLWEQVLKVFLSDEDAFRHSGWNPAAYKRVVLILAITILGADAALFYLASTQMGWAGTSFSLSALLATAAYVAVTVFVSLVSVNLRRPSGGR